MATLGENPLSGGPRARARHLEVDFVGMRLKNQGVSLPSPRFPAPRLFAFDTSDDALSLLPLCARRALDVVGCKLSLSSYQALSVEDRYALARCGSRDVVDPIEVAEVVGRSSGELSSVPPLADPNPEQVPALLEGVLGPTRSIPLKVWRGLSNVERYALVKVAAKGSPERIEGCYDEIIGSRQLSTHLRPGGGVVMVSIAGKAETNRLARAESYVAMSRQAFERLSRADVPKGDVLGTARIAGIMACKKTAELIPLCHPLPLQHAEIDLELIAKTAQVRVECKVEVFGRTGVEMEALLGASTAALTIYDMLKSIDRDLVIGPTRLLEKQGGRSGHYRAAPPAGGSTS